MTSSLLRSVMRAKKLPAPHRADGLYVNKTCQVLLQVKNQKFRRVVWASTGMAGHETPNGTGAIYRKIEGWVESTLYPGAFMLDPMFFFPGRPAIAIHGSVSNSLVHPYPASHGCVRTWRPQIQQIFGESPIGTKVKVYGKY
jgi:lipoprotein-anchoring transpeptidase ErfK/SrfK